MNTSIDVDLNRLPDIGCACGGSSFLQVYRFKHLSALQSPDGQESKIQLGRFICLDCGCPMEQ